jgi:hypothetical protein
VKKYIIKSDSIKTTWIFDRSYPVTIRPVAMTMLVDYLGSWIHMQIPVLQKEMDKGKTFAFVCEHFNEKDLDLGPGCGEWNDIESLYIIACSVQKGLEVYLYVGSRDYIIQSQLNFKEHWEKQIVQMRDAVMLWETKPSH